MSEQHTDEMRAAFQKYANADGNYDIQWGQTTYVDKETVEAWKLWQAATASAEARYLPVIEKLVDHLKNLEMRIQNELPLPGPESGIHQNILLTLAEAAPLLKGEV